MNTAVDTKTYTLQIPQADARFFSELVKKMGWAMGTRSKATNKKCGLDIALEDIKKGDLKSFKSIDELKDYLHS